MYFINYDVLLITLVSSLTPKKTVFSFVVNGLYQMPKPHYLKLMCLKTNVYLQCRYKRARGYVLKKTPFLDIPRRFLAPGQRFKNSTQICGVKTSFRDFERQRTWFTLTATDADRAVARSSP